MAEYIEREALMKNFCGYDLTKCVKYGNKGAYQRHNSYSTMMMYEIADEIIDAPAADVAPVVHGSMRHVFFSYQSDHYKCTCCDGTFLTNAAKYWNYCPNCGARMDLEV